MVRPITRFELLIDGFITPHLSGGVMLCFFAVSESLATIVRLSNPPSLYSTILPAKKSSSSNIYIEVKSKLQIC
jgi:hypothetical protein